jgi:hypothetical protein
LLRKEEGESQITNERKKITTRALRRKENHRFMMKRDLIHPCPSAPLKSS